MKLQETILLIWIFALCVALSCATAKRETRIAPDASSRATTTVGDATSYTFQFAGDNAPTLGMILIAAWLSLRWRRTFTAFARCSQAIKASKSVLAKNMVRDNGWLPGAGPLPDATERYIRKHLGKGKS